MQKKVYWIEGDGIGSDVWKAARPVIDAAISSAYGSERSLEWVELLAGEKALKETGSLLPETTIEALRHADLAIKGPLGTPVGTGFRSLNVTLRQTLDLYACIRPIRALPGIESPVKHPEQVDMIVFRENTEDVYAGIEYKANTPEAKKLVTFLHDELGAQVDSSAAVGIKPMTERGSKRLIRASLNYAIEQHKPNLTLVHKGNIMKFTEGAFRQYGYDLAAAEFADQTVTEADVKAGKSVLGKLLIKDRIADAMFQEALLYPEHYSVLATPNLNGDYLSDALAAQVGGLGLAPGLNRSDSLFFYEATHGTAPNLANKDRANPCSLILCGALLLDHIGWHEAAHLITKAIDHVLFSGNLTEDLVAHMPTACIVGCTEFGELLEEELAKPAQD